MRSIIFAAVLAFGPSSVLAQGADCGADLSMRFVEGAPVDRFVITNGSDQTYPLTHIAVDLSPSRGRLIFDTHNGGAGVEVYQPFVSDMAELDVRDGATGLRIPTQALAGGASVSFSIDVDDQLTQSDMGQIRVSGSEIAGAQVVFAMDGQPYLATFTDDNIAQVAPSCSDNS